MTGPDCATYRVGNLNAPTTTNKGSKKNLLPPHKRVLALIALMGRLTLDVLGCQEIGTVTKTVFRAHPKWRYLAAAPNSVTRTNRKGSALILRASLFKVLHRKAIRVPYPKGFLGRLKQPRVLTADANTDQRTLWHVVHPPRRSELAMQRRVWAYVAVSIEAALRENIAVVVLTDSNNLALAQEMLRPYGIRLVESVDVQGVFIAVRLLHKVDSGVETKDVHDVLTDHRGLPWADLELDDSVNTTATRIPA